MSVFDRPTQVDGEDADARLRTEMSFTEVVDTGGSAAMSYLSSEHKTYHPHVLCGCHGRSKMSNCLN